MTQENEPLTQAPSQVARDSSCKGREVFGLSDNLRRSPESFHETKGLRVSLSLPFDNHQFFWPQDID